MNFKQFLPIAEWLPGYKKSDLIGDMSAGFTVGVLLIPQGMAYALIAGLPPVYGLYAAIVPQIIYAFFGTSRQLSVGPVAMDSLLVASGVSLMATEGTEAYILLAVILAGLVGFFQFVLGVMRMGFVTNLLSKPVISGFTSAAAIIIGLNQLKYLMGVNLVKTNQVFVIVWSALQEIGNIHWVTLVLGIGGVILIKSVKKWNAAIPGSLIAVIIGILLVYFFQLQETGVSIVKDIPEGLPTFQWHNLTEINWGEMIPLAVTISVVAFMESYSVSKSLEAKARDYKVRANQELVALGLSNLIGSLFQSYPVTGGFSRSAVNYLAGAKTPMASVFSALIVGFTLLLLTPLFYYLPQAILASVILVAVSSLIDIKYAFKLFRDSKMEFGLLVVTFAITLHFSMVPGIVTGIVLSILMLLYQLAYPHIAQLGRLKGHHEFRNVKRFKNLETWEHVMVLRLDAPLNFINIQYFKEYVENAISKSGEKIETIILDAGPVSHLDASASQGLMDLLEYLKKLNIQLLFCDLIGPVRDTMKRTGLDEVISKDHVFLDLNEAVKFATTKQQGSYQEYALQSNEEA